MINKNNWIDISVPLQKGMVVSRSDIKFHIERRCFIEKGDVTNNSNIHMSVHTGTHIDAPRHHFVDGKSIDQIPFDVVIGPARVIEIHDEAAIKIEELEQQSITKGERILFKTKNSQRCWQKNTFSPDYVYITQEAARYLADAEVKLIGIDYLSVGSRAETAKTLPETHKILLSAEVWLLEGLNLAGVAPGNYNFICLPIRLMQADGSPARAVLQLV